MEEKAAAEAAAARAGGRAAADRSSLCIVWEPAQEHGSSRAACGQQQQVAHCTSPEQLQVNSVWCSCAWVILLPAHPLALSQGLVPLFHLQTHMLFTPGLLLLCVPASRWG